jgi:heat shock protein HslJ
VPRAGLLLAATLLLAGCAAQSGPGQRDRPDISGSWELVEGVPAAADLPRSGATLVAEGDTLAGRSFCNSYSSTYRLDDGVLVVDGLGGTEMGCEPAVMAAESAYLAVLGAADGAAIEDGDLLLTGDGGTLRFRRQPPVPTSELAGTDWVLDTLVQGESASSVTAGSTLRLDPDGTFQGTTACRTVSGTWTRSADQLTFPQLVTDDRACPEDLRAQDDHELAVLGSAGTIGLAGNRLTLTGASGDGLVYRDAA